MTSFLVEPKTELPFNYAPRRYLDSSFLLINIIDQPLAFKIKTNVPVCYLVKPHFGTIPPKQSVEINITMQPTEYNPQNAAITDKFLINIIPVPSNIDLNSLADQPKFQAVWDSTPKSEILSHKLKVVLRFEANSTNTSILDKTGEESPKNLVPENMSMMTDKEKTFLTVSAPNKGPETSFNENTRESIVSPSLMVSFTDDMPSSAIGRSSYLGQPASQAPVNEELVSKVLEEKHIEKPKQEENPKEMEKPKEVEKPNVIEAPKILEIPRIEVTKVEEVPKKRVEIHTPEQNKGEAEEKIKDEAKRNTELLEEKLRSLEKRVDELTVEKKILNQKYQDLTGKAEQQTRMLFEVSEENTRLKSELENLKTSTFRERSTKREQGSEEGYQLWHIIAVTLAAMVLGAFLSSN